MLPYSLESRREFAHQACSLCAVVAPAMYWQQKTKRTKKNSASGKMLCRCFRRVHFSRCAGVCRRGRDGDGLKKRTFGGASVSAIRSSNKDCFVCRSHSIATIFGICAHHIYVCPSGPSRMLKARKIIIGFIGFKFECCVVHPSRLAVGWPWLHAFHFLTYINKNISTSIYFNSKPGPCPCP